MIRPSFRLYLVTDRKLFPSIDGLVSAIAAVARSLPPGELGVEVREKDLPARDLLSLTARVLEAVDGTGTEVLVNDRLDVVIAAGAAGVHLPASGLAPSDARAAFAGRIGVSTHFSGEVAGLAPGATDFATFGPVFDTASKRRYGPPVGLDALRAAVAASRVPVYAIGGITEATASLVAGAGIAGIAGIKSVLAAPDPGRAAAAVIRAAFPGLP